MKPDIESRLQNVLVLDGGVSSEIATTHGHLYINKDPLWSCRLLTLDQETIKKVHLSFLEAGSDVIGTVTYQSSIPGFQKYFNVTAKDARQLIQTGVRLAVETRDGFWEQQQGRCPQKLKPLVAVSLGPYGAYLADASEYTGDYMEKVTTEANSILLNKSEKTQVIMFDGQELWEFHKERIEAALEAGPDMLAIETIPAKEEAIIIAKLMKQEFPGQVGWICFSCKDGEFVCHGETLQECTDSLLEYDQIIGVGVNCTAPQYVSSLLQKVSLEVKSKKTIVVYANSGEHWTPEKSWHTKETCSSVVELVPTWRSLGAQWIGGCCRITPSEIRQIQQTLTY